MTPTLNRLLWEYGRTAENLGHWQAKDGLLGGLNLEAAAKSYAKARAALV